MIRQISMSAPILNFQRDVTKSVTTSRVVSSACVKMATSSVTKSTAWVRLHSFLLQFGQLNCNNVTYLLFRTNSIHTKEQKQFCAIFVLSLCVYCVTYMKTSSYGSRTYRPSQQLSKHMCWSDSAVQLWSSGPEHLLYVKLTSYVTQFEKMVHPSSCKQLTSLIPLSC